MLPPPALKEALHTESGRRAADTRVGNKYLEGELSNSRGIGIPGVLVHPVCSQIARVQFGG